MMKSIRFIFRIMAVIVGVVVVLAMLGAAIYLTQVENIEREVSLEMRRYGWPNYQRTELLYADNVLGKYPLIEGYVVFETGCQIGFIGYVYRENGHWMFDRLNPVPAADEGCTAEDYEAMR